MKIVINYDLMDKLAEANSGYSLKRCIKRTLGYTSISTVIGMIDNFVGGNVYPDLISEIGAYFCFHSIYTGMFTFVFRNLSQEAAKIKIEQLVEQLRNSCIKTDETAILDAYKYKTVYDINLDNSLPKIEQKKYIKVPVRDEYFGDKEISLLQEHIVGSREYTLTLGEPEEKKVYSLIYGKTLGR